VLTKTKSLQGKHDKIHASYNALLTTNKSMQQDISLYLKIYFGIITTKEHFFISTKDTIFLTTPTAERILPYLRCEKLGIPIAKKTKDSFRPLHGLAVTLGHLADKMTIELTEEQTQKYTTTESIPYEDVQDPANGEKYPYRILTHQ
jgi:NOL1/NOP2/fmu family ribosome biogenesis protein